MRILLSEMYDIHMLYIFRFFYHFQVFDFVLDTVDNILDTVYGLISKAQTLDNSANR